MGSYGHPVTRLRRRNFARPEAVLVSTTILADGVNVRTRRSGSIATVILRLDPSGLAYDGELG
jgi:hypothetical protein